MGPPLLRRRSAAGLALIVMATTLALIPSAPASAHSCLTADIRLGSFALDDPGNPPQLVNPWFYWQEEGKNLFATAWFFQWCDDQPTASVDWSTVTGSATSVDFQIPDPSAFEADNPGYPQNSLTPVPDTKQIDIVNDTIDEPLESFTVALTANPGVIHIVPPTQAPIYIVDDDESTRYATVGGSVPPISESGGKMKFPIFRAGSASTSTTIDLTYGGGVNNVDFSGPSSVTFAAGKRFEIATISAIDDPTPELDQDVTITLSGGTIDGPSSMSFTIEDDDGANADTTPPVTWFHHPKHNKDYKHGAYLARTIHVFIPLKNEDNPVGPAEPSGIDTTQFALRRLKTGGACQWWTAGRDWRGGGCGSPNWITFKSCGGYSVDRDLCDYDLKKDLASSKGTKIRNYRVLSRAKDGSANANWETNFEVGRNKNTFEINKK